MDDEELVLVVNGRRYGGWKTIRVSRSIEGLSGSFDLTASDRWGGQDQPWPIAEEDECRVEIGGRAVIDGYVEGRQPTLAGDLSFSGYDRAAALVACSAVLPKWTYREIKLVDLARKLAQPFGVSVALQAGISLPARTIEINPGDTPAQVLEREAAQDGVLLMSDGAGGILLARAGKARAGTPLIQGQNVKDATVLYDGSERFHRYIVMTSVPGTDTASGEATQILAEAIDEGVRRKSRVLVIRPEVGLTADAARRRADWEARVRAARAETVRVVVQGWTQPSGELWPLNELVQVKIPRVGVDGDLLIAQVDHSVGESGKISTLRLVRPDAFTPEPKAVVAKDGPGGRWKELERGAL